MNQDNQEKIQGAIKRILVVDDDVETREMFYQLLKKSGYQAITLPSGKAALEFLKKNRTDLIILDEKLPGMDGLLTLKNIREFDNETPVLMMTGYVVGELQINALRLGVNDFLTKGISESRLLKTVQETIERHQTFALQKKSPAKGGKIMIVDDETEVRNMLERFLSKHNHEVRILSSGEEAITLLKTGTYQPDVVLVDVNLSGMDGFVTLKQIRNFNNDVNIIMMSGTSDSALERQALELGALAFFNKPINLEHMNLTIKMRVLGQNQP